MRIPKKIDATKAALDSEPTGLEPGLDTSRRNFISALGTGRVTTAWLGCLGDLDPKADASRGGQGGPNPLRRRP